MISAWARMCKIIGPGFVQYLPVVMGPLIQAASLKPEIAFVDCMSVKLLEFLCMLGQITNCNSVPYVPDFLTRFTVIFLLKIISGPLPNF